MSATYHRAGAERIRGVRGVAPPSHTAGFRSKKPAGFSQNDTVSVGITGQSSGRVMWWMPNTYQSTTSVPEIGRFCAVQAGRPSSRSLWLQNSPHGQRSSGWYGVTPQGVADHLGAAEDGRGWIHHRRETAAGD